MNNEAKHTPTLVQAITCLSQAKDISPADKEVIFRVCNAHDELVAALEASDIHLDVFGLPDYDITRTRNAAALAKARGEA